MWGSFRIEVPGVPKVVFQVDRMGFDVISGAGSLAGELAIVYSLASTTSSPCNHFHEPRPFQTLNPSLSRFTTPHNHIIPHHHGSRGYHQDPKL